MIPRKCSRKTHFNTQCPPARFSDLPTVLGSGKVVEGAVLHVVFCVERNLGPRAICSSIFIFHASKVKYLHAPFELGNSAPMSRHRLASLNIGQRVESVQDFLIKLDMKPCMHLVEISIFSLNHVIVRLTKIMNNLLEHLKILNFKDIFLCKKLVKLLCSFIENLGFQNTYFIF